MAVASNLVDLSIVTSPASGHFVAAAGEQGESISIVCDCAFAEQLNSLTNVKATLEGLPNRVTCESVAVEPKSQAIRFQVRLQPDAPVGNYVGLACRLSGDQHGQAVSFVIARDGQLTIGQPGQIVRDSTGRPLNRVEALRKKRSDSTSLTQD